LREPLVDLRHGYLMPSGLEGRIIMGSGCGFENLTGWKPVLPENTL
jgi:hypothetical protein